MFTEYKPGKRLGQDLNLGPPDYKSSGLTTLLCYLPLNPQYREVVTSRCHGGKISGSQQTVVLQI